MLRTICPPTWICALLIVAAGTVVGCNDKKSEDKKPNLELNVHELTLVQGTQDVLDTKHGIPEKAEGQPHGVTVDIGQGVIAISADKDAKLGTYDIKISNKEGSSDTLKLTIKKAESR